MCQNARLGITKALTDTSKAAICEAQLKMKSAFGAFEV